MLLIGPLVQWIVKTAYSKEVNVRLYTVININLEGSLGIHYSTVYVTVVELIVLGVPFDCLFVAFIISELMIGISDVQLADDLNCMLYATHLNEQ
jgi:hypothetical protein